MHPKCTEYDAVIVGSGPNGLSAGILLAQHGLSVLILEAKTTIGGGTRTQELTQSGYLHDVCSAIHPTAFAAPFLKTLPLSDYGLDWCFPTFQVAHPLDNGDAVVISKNLTETIKRLGTDGQAYHKLVHGLITNWDAISHDLFGPIRVPKNPIALSKFGLKAIQSAKQLAKSTFREERNRTFFAGLAGHSILPLEQRFTASFGLIFAASLHVADWAIAKGGSASITTAMANYFRSLGGDIQTSTKI